MGQLLNKKRLGYFALWNAVSLGDEIDERQFVIQFRFYGKCGSLGLQVGGFSPLRQKVLSAMEKACHCHEEQNKVTGSTKNNRNFFSSEKVIS